MAVFPGTSHHRTRDFQNESVTCPGNLMTVGRSQWVSLSPGSPWSHQMGWGSQCLVPWAGPDEAQARTTFLSLCTPAPAHKRSSDHEDTEALHGYLLSPSRDSKFPGHFRTCLSGNSFPIFEALGKACVYSWEGGGV